MDSRQAKAVLACYRPGLDDPQSAPFAQALEQARRDPALARWLEREAAFDAAIAARLRQAPVPAGLLERILAARAAEPPRLRWRRPVLAAASLAALLAAAIVTVALLRRAPANDLETYRRQMGALVAGDYKMDVEAGALPAIQEFLSRRHWPSADSVPAGLQGYPLEGAMAVEWRGHRVSLICFGAEGDDGKDLWLFVTERDTLPEAPSSTVPGFAPAGTLMTAAWTSADKVYLLAGRGDERSLRAILAGGSFAEPRTP